MRIVQALKRFFRIEQPEDSLSPAYRGLKPIAAPDPGTEDGLTMAETEVSLVDAQRAAAAARSELFLKDISAPLAGVHVHPVTGVVAVTPDGERWFDTGRRASDPWTAPESTDSATTTQGAHAPTKTLRIDGEERSS